MSTPCYYCELDPGSCELCIHEVNIEDLLQQARREGWEQCKREAAGIIDDTEEVESMSVYAQLGDAHRTKMSIVDAIAAMEYKGESK